MADFNKVILAGRLTRDIEVRYTPKGIAIGGGSIAVNRKWKTEDGEQKEEVTFAEFTCWGRTAEVMAQYLKKGSPLLVEGRLTLDQWEDKQTQEKRSKLKVTVEGFQFLEASEPKGSEDGGNPEQNAPRGQSAPRTAQEEGPPVGREAAEDFPEDDVPF